MSPDRSRIFWQGLWAGLIGYSTTAIILALGNVLAGRSPFYAPALLGGALFYGVHDVSDVVVGPGPVFAYNGFHLVFFLALGVVASWLAALAERGPHLWYAGLTFYIFVAFHLFGLALAFSAPLLDATLAWSTMVSGTAASVGMAFFLLRVHPRLLTEIRDFAAQDADLVDTAR